MPPAAQQKQNGDGGDIRLSLSTGRTHTVKVSEAHPSVVSITAAPETVSPGQRVTFTAVVTPDTAAARQAVRWRVHMGGHLLSDETPGKYANRFAVTVPVGRSGETVVARAFVRVPAPYTFAVANISHRRPGHRLETAAQLRMIMPAAPRALVERCLPHLLSAMERYGIADPLVQAHFLAQVGHESIDMTALTQQGIDPADPFEVGRGMLQITHRYNYEAFQAHIGEPDILHGRNYLRVASDLSLATRAATWFWSTRKDAGSVHDLSYYARNDDAFAVSVLVNGWRHNYMPNGYADRIRHLLAAKLALGIDSAA